MLSLLLSLVWCCHVAKSSNTTPSLTVINYAHLHSDTLWIRTREESKLISALETRGAFVVTNHGVNRDVMDQAWSDSAAFFESDAANKNAVPMTKDYLYGFQGLREEELSRSESNPDTTSSAFDEKETFQVMIGAVNTSRAADVQWPALPSSMKASWTAYYHEIERLSLGLLQSISSISNVSQSFFADHSYDHVSALRAAHYPKIAIDESVAFRCSAHSDWTLLTVLRQDEVGGLQIEDTLSEAVEGEGEQWLSVVTDFYDFVVNAGDLMERWSNGRFKAIRHRVVDYQNGRRITQRRQSMAYFTFPNEEMTIAPIHNASEAAVFETVTVGGYLRAKHLSAQKNDD